MLNNTTKADVLSGFLVFLIALPLCLGISEASGFPAIAGIYTAIIGGLLVTFLSNAQLAIKGPAAGLIVIAVGAVNEFDELYGNGDETALIGYHLTLAVVVVSGLLQIVLGLIKSGKLGDFFPVSVIHGMLAAIGLIIISKETPKLLGVVPEKGLKPFELLMNIPNYFMEGFSEVDGLNSSSSLNPEIALIGFISLAILFGHTLVKKGFISKFPAPLIVLIVAIPLGFYFDLSHEHDYDLGSLHYHLDPEKTLVRLKGGFANLINGDTLPDFSQLLTYTSLKYIIMFTLVGSIESILSAKAVDTLDPEGRKTNMNKDLIAVGLGNTLAGLVGGLPMITEIVRSSANISNGAKSRMSNFFHSLFLFLFVLLAVAVIERIPIAALSAMLVFTGFRLASPKEFKHMHHLGMDQFILFLTTLLVTFFTDLLVGVATGIVLKIIISFIKGARFGNLSKIQYEEKNFDSFKQWNLKGVTTFINYLPFKSKIDSEDKSSSLELNFENTKFIDHTFLSNVEALKKDFQKEGGTLTVTGLENHSSSSDDPLSSKTK